MVVVSYSGKEINAKLVYYGPGLSGKTTNLESIYQSVPTANRGKMVSMKTRTERTLFFDFLPIDLGDIGGFKTRFLLYTVPGQVYYNATRKLVLRGVDAVIFVADSARGKMEENLDSLQNLRDNLEEYGLNLDALPWVIQYNKRDLPDVYSVEELEETLNPGGVPHFEAVATTGEGVFESFRGIARILLQKLNQEIKLGDGKGKASAAPVKPAPVKPAASGPDAIPTAPVAAPGDPEDVPELPRSAQGPAAPYRPSVPPAMAERAKQAPPPHVPEPAPPSAAEPPAPPSRPQAPEPAPPSPVMEASDPPSRTLDAPILSTPSPDPEPSPMMDAAPPAPPAPPARPAAQDGPPRYSPRPDPVSPHARQTPPPSEQAPAEPTLAEPTPPPAQESPMQWDAPASPDPGSETGLGSGIGAAGPDPLARPGGGDTWPAENEGGSMSDFGSMLAGDALDADPAPSPDPATPEASQPLPPLAPPQSPPEETREAAPSDDRLKRAEELARRLEESERAQEEKKVGFLGRLFGRKPKPDKVEPPVFEEPIEEPREETEAPVAFTDPREALDRPDALSARAPETFETPETFGTQETFEAPEPTEEPAPAASLSFPDPAPDAAPEDVEPEADEDAPVVTGQAKLSGIAVSPQGSEDMGPVVIQRQIQVPITLGKEELVRGATLRLTLEIQVEAEESEDASSDRDSQVA